MKLNEIYEYPVTKPIPYGKAFHLLFGLVQFLTLSIFVIWAAATAGYETISITSPNYNMTQELWYSGFVPQILQRQLSQEGMCSGATTFTPGASFSSTNDLFSYAIGSYYSEPGATTRPSDVIEYRGTTLDSCTPVDIMINVDSVRNTVDAKAVVICYGAWPVVATNHYAFALDTVKSVLVPGSRSSLGITTWTIANSSGARIFRALDYMATDLLGTVKLVRAQTNSAAPSEYSVILSTTAICPIAYLGTAACPADAGSWSLSFTSDAATNTYPNGTQNRLSTNTENPDYIVPARNLATALHAATVWDLGSTTKVSNNIYTTLSTLSGSIKTVNTNATTSGVTGSTLTGAVAFNADTAFPMPATGPVVIRASYLCRVKQLKSAASFIIAVAGLAMSLFTTFIAIATIAIVMILRLHRKDLMYCQGHNSSNPQLSPIAAPYDPKFGASTTQMYSPVPTLPSQPMYQAQQGYQTGQYYVPNQGGGWQGQQHP